MKRRALMTPMAAALFGSLAFFGLGAPAQAAPEPLFPKLRGEDFPDEANEVRFEWLEAARGSLVGRVFHTRPNDMLFPSAVTARVSADPKTGNEVLEVVRLDDDCLAFADQVGMAPEKGCLAVTATHIAPGVERVTFRAAFFDSRVHFYLVQSREDESEWNLAQSGREGEPQLLRLRTRENGESQVVDWELAYGSERNSVALPLRVTLPIEAIRVAGVSTIHAALASAPEFFYDMADFLVWEVLREEQIVDTGVPEPGDEEDDCEVLTMCPAEYQSCTPTPGGWLACNDMGGDRTWVGGSICRPDCEDGPRRDPDWQAGSASTSPIAAAPRFDGLDAVSGGHRLDYRLTSVLQKEPTLPETSSELAGYAGHVVKFTLLRKGSDESVGCSETRFVPMTATATIAVGSSKRYKGSESSLVCQRPSAGEYELEYFLDPLGLWTEDSEGNNRARMRGTLRVK